MTHDLPSLEDVHTAVPLIDHLPGSRLPYAVHLGEGLRFDLGRALATVIARPEDTGGAFWAAWLLGGRDVATPAFSLPDPLLLYVTEGRVQLRLPTTARILTPGDSATVPAGTPLALRLLSARTQVLTVVGGESSYELLPALGRTTQRRMYDLDAADVDPVLAAELAERFAVRLHPETSVSSASGAGLVVPDGGLSPLATALPEDLRAYVLEAGEGEHWESLDQLNTYLARARNTAGAFFAMHTSGGRTPYIPRHFHRLHTENFVCLQGRILLHANGQEIALHPGDFLHAPAGTVHSFSFDTHQTQMLGILTTDVFEPFFRWMNRPTDRPVHQELGDRAFPVEAFSRVQAELDVEVVGPPPR